jgi:alkylation response protein AidB-like acyl-CoA dehydrogenase
VNFAFDEEQEEFRSSLRRFLTERAPLSAVREWVETDRGYDEGVWRQLADQLGLPSLHIPEEYGGAGDTLLEAAVAAEELGRALTPVPWFATATAAETILTFGTEQQKKELLPGIASGEIIATVAASERGRSFTTLAPFETRAQSRGADVSLHGEKVNVIAGHVADVIVVIASTAEGGAGAYVVRADSDGVTRERRQTLDLTRPVATVTLEGATAERLGEGPVERATAQRSVEVARALLACEMVGGTEACLQMSVDYSKDRFQFNRPIGSFQAIKHKCAEMAVGLDAARAAAYYAAFTASEDSSELATAAPLAKAEAAEAFAFAAGWNIQIHGGIGFTWEHDAHLYFRRAKADEVLLGTTSQNRMLLADRVGL